MTSADWQLDRGAAEEALRLLRSARTVLMPTHKNVDADGLASPLAIMYALAPLGAKLVPMVSDGDVPSNLEFLPGVERVLRYGIDPLPNYDAMCLVDVSDLRRLHSFYADDPSRVDGRVPIVNVDHHVTNDRFGAVNIVEPGAASSAEIVADLLQVWGCEVTTTIAECLLAGIYGDTLGLRTPDTTSRTMRTAADLVDTGARLSPIVDALFRLKPMSTVCLWERALRNVQWTGTLIWTEVSKEMLRSCSAVSAEAEGLVNFLSGTEGSRAAGLLYEDDGGWRVSLRSLSEEVDVAAVAAVLGGGGHARAAGAQIRGGLAEKTAFLEKVSELIAPDGGDDA